MRKVRRIAETRAFSATGLAWHVIVAAKRSLAARQAAILLTVRRERAELLLSG
jgi:hypothetical protein